MFGEIDAFGRAAAEAGLADTLPADVVRAHFAARFADADARQPFLAGGVTFCRMVPMRLIPFRVICLLGLNDRDYPRQEPSPVLNRLAAALDKPGQRRRGDRSVRDDDRFLFLQLVSAAERVLLSRAISAAMRSTAPRASRRSSYRSCSTRPRRISTIPPKRGERLVLHHPLQPFGRAADTDARRVRFDPAWSDALATAPAAQRDAAVRAVAAAARSRTPRRVDKIDYHALRRFLIDPPAIVPARTAARAPRS